MAAHDKTAYVLRYRNESSVDVALLRQIRGPELRRWDLTPDGRGVDSGVERGRGRPGWSGRRAGQPRGLPPASAHSPVRGRVLRGPSSLLLHHALVFRGQ